ncbi:MAG: carbonic anhydrase [Geminicoccaceae bacterium]
MTAHRLQESGALCGCHGRLLGRRELGRLGLATLLAAPFVSRRAFAQERPATPEAALKALMDGNKRFVAEQSQPTACAVDLAELKQGTASGQAPFAAVLGCADSRVPTELIFDQTIGDVFVARVAGNIASADIIASLEYGAAVLGTKTILVLAHSSCGAVEATIKGKAVPGQISTLYRSIRPAVDRAGTDLAAAAKANAQIQAGLLRDASPLLGGMVKDGTLGIAAGYYELATGVVTLLDSDAHL